MEINWHKQWQRARNTAPFERLDNVFNMSKFTTFPSIEQLNQMLKIHQPKVDIRFASQDTLDLTGTCYESFIAENNLVPTRLDSWHDLFNALVWMQFPHTKTLLNQLHVEHIRQHGISPRTKRRNHITHFDECGLVLAVKDEQICELLAQHSWNEAFVTHRQVWGREVIPMLFGHANLEMLLNPFIGLTGKWMAIKVSDEFFDPAVSDTQRTAIADVLLSEGIKQFHWFDHSNILKPIPLLGIPGWWDANRHPEFYADTDYFRPKRQALKT